MKALRISICGSLVRNRRPGRHREPGGATLLELMVVVVIISILAVLAVPGLRGFLTKNQVRQQADRLTAMINRTRELAMEDGHPWRMCLTPGSRTWICYGDRDDDSQMDPEERQLGPYELEGSVAFGCRALKGPNNTDLPDDGVTFANNRLSFSPMGCCMSGTIYLKDERRSIALRVLSASGVVKVWQYEKGWEVLK